MIVFHNLAIIFVTITFPMGFTMERRVLFYNFIAVMCWKKVKYILK